MHVIGEVGGRFCKFLLLQFAILPIAEEKRVQKHEKILESQVLVAMLQRKANCAPERGSGGFSPGKICINSRPFSANFFKGKSLRGRNCHPPPPPPHLLDPPERKQRSRGQSPRWGVKGAKPP